jgi:cellulose synthase/poly-beta-1,6-N-acetylglucosamine synthase-like glycosyltransferase
VTVLHVVIPLLSVGFLAFHAAFARWLLEGIERGRRKLPASYETPQVTILVAARNETANLPDLIGSLLKQSYPVDRTQILVVDDRSSDDTAELAVSLGKGRVEVVRVDELPAGMGPKKNAIMKGLTLAKGEIVVQIDADNRPGTDWLGSIVAAFQPRTGAVCGLVLHRPRASSVSTWFHGIWAVEALGWSAVQAAAIGGGKPISANGGNLAYRIAAFRDVGGYGRNKGVVSGDDDFLVQSISDSGRWDVVCPLDPRSFVFTTGPESWSQVWEQRKRWGSKCIRYDLERVLLLGAVYLSYAHVALLALFGLEAHWILGWSGAVVAAIFLEAWLLVRRTAMATGSGGLLKWFPAAAAIQIPLVLAAVGAGTLGRFRWKDGPTRAVRN